MWCREIGKERVEDFLGASAPAEQANQVRAEHQSTGLNTRAVTVSLTVER